MELPLKPYEELLKKAAEGFSSLPLRDRVSRLQKIGILDKNGKLAEHYQRKLEKKSG